MSMTESELERLLKSNPSLRVAGVETPVAGKLVSIPPQYTEKPVQSKCGTKQTKCEMEYGRMLACEFPECEIVPWGITLRLANNHKYTADFVVKDATGILLVAECKQRGKGKNGFRQPSYQRAKVMFDQSRVEYPFWKWRWSEKHDGQWSEHKY